MRSSDRMGRNRKARQDKAKELRKRAERNARDAEKARRYADTYPRFEFRDERRVDPEFVRLVRRAVATIDFDSDSFIPMERRIYADGKRVGFRQVFDDLERAMAGAEGVARFVPLHVKLKLGHLVFEGIPRAELLRYIPYNNVDVMPTGNRILVLFRALERRRGPRGTIYYSRHRPKLLIDGEEKVVGFSEHAITQACTRIDSSWATYAGTGDVFAFFDQCVYFERANLYPDQLAFTFYDECPIGFWRHQYVDQSWRARPASTRRSGTGSGSATASPGSWTSLSSPSPPTIPALGTRRNTGRSSGRPCRRRRSSG